MLPAWKPFDIGVFLVVQVGPAKTRIIPPKCTGLNETEVRPGICAHPDNVAGILGDAWVNEDYGKSG